MDPSRTSVRWCRHERCKIIEVHEAHDEDFERAKIKRRRAKQTREQLARDPNKVILRYEERAVEEIYGATLRGGVGGDHQLRGPITGPVAIVQCPECKGGGCGWCNETGEMTLMRYHLWKRDCG